MILRRAAGMWCRCGLLLTALMGVIVTDSALPQTTRGQETGQDAWRAGSASLFQPQFQRNVSDMSKGWRVTLTAWKPCPEALSNECFYFTIGQETGMQTSEFRLANQTAEVDAISILSSSRVAILGRASPNQSIVSIVELPSGKDVDSFICEGPALSPDRRFVAYTKFSPAHPGYGYSASAEYLVYDLTVSPQDNRTVPDRARPLEPYDVGWPLYPQGLKNTPGDNMYEGHDVPIHRMNSGGFFWLDKSNAVSFVDRWEGVNRLVVGDVSHGIQQPKVTVYPIDRSRVLDLPKCKSVASPSDFEGWTMDPSSLIDINDIQLAPASNHVVRLSLSPHPCLTITTLDVSINALN